MEPIRGILFEPVGCLADFPSQPFLEIAAQLFGRKMKPTRSASRAYWHLLNLMEAAGANTIESLEVAAVDGAVVYDDVLPSLAELKAMGVRLFIASSLSNTAIARFLERCPHDFDAISTRDNSGGIKTAPLDHALQSAFLRPGNAMFLTDTAEGLTVGRSSGVHPARARGKCASDLAIALVGGCPRAGSSEPATNATAGNWTFPRVAADLGQTGPTPYGSMSPGCWLRNC
jgi:phosphoglycolate phosphatase-like HAD superfamily hydrolase